MKSGKYRASICYKGVSKYLGTFDTLEAAKAAYDEAWKQRLELAERELRENGIEWKKNSILGKTFGQLTVIEEIDGSYCKCACTCGNTGVYTYQSLENKNRRSCGCVNRNQPHEDLTGQRFGRLIAKQYVKRGKWICQCDCGNETIALAGDLKRNKRKSCGCLRYNKEV